MTEYKESPFGRIPEDWRVVRIKEIAETEAGGTPPTSVKEYWNGDVPWINSGKLKNSPIDSPSKYISKLGLDNSAAKMLPKGTVVIALTGATTGMVGLLDFECSANQSVVGILPSKKCNSKFLFYSLMNSRNRILRLNVGSAQPHINKGIVDNFRVVLPPIVEQNKIAEVLSSIDGAIWLVDEAIAKTERMKKGLMRKLFSEGIGHKEFKETKIGKIPKTWNLVRLKTIAESYKNGIYKPNEYYGKGYPCIRMYNIVDGYINKVEAPLLQVTERELEEYGLEPGDLVVNRVNARTLVGKAGIVPNGFGKATFESKNIRVRLNKRKIVPEFISIYVQTPSYTRQLHSRAKIAVAQATITQTDLDVVLIPLPPITEQKKITQIFLMLDNIMQLQTRRKGKLERIKKGLMNDLLSGKVRVKVD